ncbi:MAG: hypothetical protein HY054_09215 [Proteobacteria bacterium]|nr:hypothetical protein [Pseudomonadota bacterium]
MKKELLGAAALLAVVAPGIAHADTGGSVRLTYAGADSDADKNGVIALGGVVVSDLSVDHWRVQLNGSTVDTDQYGTSYAYGQAEVHAVYDAGQFQFGGFTGISNTNGYGWWEYGVEAAMNFDRGHIALSAAGATSPYTSYDNISSYAAEGSFSLTDDLHVGATLSTTDFGNYGSGDSINSWGLNVGYNIPDTHFSVGVGYRSSDDANSTKFFGVSLVWNFGDGAAGRVMPGASALVPDAIVDQ